MAEDGADSYARQLAQEALSRANEAYRLAASAERTAEQALNEVRELEQRVGRLEGYVEALIRMLEQRIQELIARTESVRSAVETQGQQIKQGVDQTTESVRTGFTTLSHQEVKARLLDSRTALLGLATKLLTARNALRTEFDQAQRRTDEIKSRFTEAFERTVDALKRDISRLGSQILRVQSEDFKNTIERHLPAARQAAGVFEIARQVGTASLADRDAAMKAHLHKATFEGLGDFEEQRRAFLDQVSSLVHSKLKVAEGHYALRVYLTEGRAGRECLLGAAIEPGAGRVAFRPIEAGLGRWSGKIAHLWEGSRSRALSADERVRVKNYVQQLQSNALLTAEEAGIIQHHLDQGAIQIHVPIVESDHGTAA